MTVQFQSVAEKLTPHDTVFTFASLAELRDSKLSAACSLHTASASVKSSNESLHPRGLAEITEDASESPIDKAHNTKVPKEGSGGDEDHLSLGDSQSEKTNGTAGANRHHSQSLSITRRSPPRPRTSSSNTDKALPSRPESRDKIAPHAILDYGDPETRRSIEGRLSSQSGRPSTRDIPPAYEYKPKVKLGPRPSMDSSASRLEKSNGTGSFRPVSTLPAGLRMPPRKVVSGRPKSSQAQSNFSDRISSKQPLPPAPITPIRIPDRNATIANNGLPTPAKTPEPKSPKMTPEKRRLMKALQIRQKQLAAQKSVTGNGIETMPNEQENTVPDTEDSVSSTVACGVTPLGESDSEHVSIGVSKEEHRDVEASPISLPETCEEPSTQASSITDDEEVFGRRKQDFNTKPEYTKSEPPILEPSNPQPATSQSKNQEELQLPSEAATKDGQCPATSDENFGSEVKAHKPEPMNENLPVEEQHVLPPPNSPAELPLNAKDGLSMSEGYSEKDNEGSTVVDVLPALHSPPLEDVGSSTKDIVATDGVSQTASSGAADKLSEHAVQSDHAPASQGATEDIENLVAPESSSSATKKAHLEHLNASEVPLPPIDDEEELSLSAMQAPSHAPPSILGSSPKVEVGSSGATSIDKCQSQTSDATATQTPSSNNINEQNEERRVRRQGVVNPMQRVSSSDHLEEHFLSDESFMEELKSATLQEAKPISVSKSPMKPVFSRSESEKSIAETRASRSVSSPLTPQSPDEAFTPRLPTPSSARSFSASRSPRPEAQQAVPPLPKKIGVSSGISQRIRALEQLSARPASPSSQTTSPNTSAFTSLRKTSQRGPPAASDVGSMNNIISRPSTAYPSPTSSPETVKSNPFKQFTKPGSTRPESVTVTATIVRDAKNKTPETPLNPSEPRAMDLHQSPLVVEHQPMGPPPLSPLKPPRPRYARYSSARSGSSSSTDRKGDASPTTSPTRRRDSFASIRSKSSRTTSDAEVPRTISDNAPSGATTPDGTKEEKKDSKRSRLMKRMSSISSMSRRSIAQALSPSPKESPIMEHHEPILETPPSSSVDVGDVNIQFPDTLVSSATSHSWNDVNRHLSYGREDIWLSTTKVS